MQSQINAHTLLYGILGYPVRHSFSPLIHNTAFQALGINAVYTAFEVEPNKLKSALNGIRALGIQGVSVTIPHKEAVIPFLDEIDPLAQKIGSVNTILNQNGHLVGTNTDAYGLYRALSEVCTLDNKSIVILGSGGAARAALFSLFHYAHPKKASIVARNQKSRENLVEQLKKSFNLSETRMSAQSFRAWSEIKKDTDILIQTTPVGMIPKTNASVLSFEDMIEGKTVMDIVYRPHETRFLSDAKAKNNTSVYGLDMLLYQGIRQFELWTNQKAPLATMKKTLIKALKKV